LFVVLMSGILSGICGCSDEGQPAAPAGESVKEVKKDPFAEHLAGLIGSITDPPTPTDNSECLVCHSDFSEEELSLNHEEAGVGCTGCHGPSEDHGGDESNVMFPDFLFGRSEIVPLCTACHKQDEHPKGEVYKLFLKKWSGQYRPNGRMIGSDSICTDCHGNHAILAPHQTPVSTK